MPERKKQKLTGRNCYGHLGGKLGARLLERFLELEWIQLEEGKTTVYEITEKGQKGFKKLGISIE